MQIEHGWRGESAIIHRRNKVHVAVRQGPGAPRRHDVAPDPVIGLGNTVMSAPITKDQFTFSLGNLSYIDSSYEELPAPVVKPETRGIGAWIGRLLHRLGEWQRRRTVMQEMAMMTDRELSDIGLSRSDINRVLDPGFAADHNRGREYICY